MNRKVVGVWHDHRTFVVEIEMRDDISLQRCLFCPQDLHAVVRAALGEAPFKPTVSEMESVMLGAVVGVPWEDPRVTYRKKSVVVIQEYVKRFLRGVEPPTEAVEAILDGKDWSL